MKTYQQIVSTFLYGTPLPRPEHINATVSPDLAWRMGVEAAKNALKYALEKERGIERAPKITAGND
jgi:hypothetical protein